MQGRRISEAVANQKGRLPGGCSLMTLTSKEGDPFWFRTCDITFDFRKEGAGRVGIEKGERLTFETGKSYQSSYKIGGISYQKNKTWLLDGMNEKGLCGGLLMLPEGVGKQSPEGGEEEIMAMEAVTRILSSCQDINEVISMAEAMEITDIRYGKEIFSATVHYHFMDQKGKEIILEATDQKRPGKFRIYREKEVLGVMTNSPVYERQKEHLALFLEQSAELEKLGEKEKEELNWDGKKIEKVCGKEMGGDICLFPGSYSSKDRFLRLAVLKALNHSGNRWCREEIVTKGISVMNTVREPENRGILHYQKIIAEKNKKPEILGNEDSKTYYLVIYDLKEKKCYYQWFDELEWTCYTL